ncbi:CocE/NonD family hydrolase [Shimia sp. Alg240-R146]|uniref:CocE/NonD family hydrolase n=1 Tax=Shimia sp. Alg240-R146 TaxID=2993449 RepID=UPI0022E522CE|nr:CocE/NonD family hydrolase [Shimia sp. Alg240-R146]
MQHVTEFPYEITEEPHVWITMPDGVRLSARIWRPKDAGPVPAILEYLPYRKRDSTAERDALTHPYMAGHGYACVRVDMRGTGDSEGLFDDEYSEQELSDGVAVIDWLAAQAWCSGTVGMMGISWGGFNGLQIAALRPEPLKAVVSICSTVDRYADDIHYKGGIMLGENPAWAATVLSWFALPPDPEIVREGGMDMWQERLDDTPFLVGRWAEHQLRDDYWKHGSVCEDYSAITAAVLSVGGWHDGYRNTIAHLVENLDAPVKGLIGPWNHKYPHFAVPEPRIDFLGEMLRWWDRWLKGIENGVEDLPDMRLWVMDSVPPKVSYDHRPGRWVALDDWSARPKPEILYFNAEALAAEAGPVQRKAYPALACGQAAGEFFPFGFGPGELPDDQRMDDALSLCFDGAVAQQACDIVGAPTVKLRLASDQPRAQVAVRLCDVAPDGSSALISHGFLNLRHRGGHEAAVDMPVGGMVDVSVVLDQCGYRLPAGHKLRVAISTSYWPFVWPEAKPVTLLVDSGTLALPVLPEGMGEGWAFEPPKAAPKRETRMLSEGTEAKRVIRDASDRSVTLEIASDTGIEEDLSTGLSHRIKHQERFSIQEDDASSAVADFRWERRMARGGWAVTVEAHVTMTGLDDCFEVTASLRTSGEGDYAFYKEWNAQIPRL